MNDQSEHERSWYIFDVIQPVVWNFVTGEKIYPELSYELIHFQVHLEGSEIVFAPYNNGNRDAIVSYDFLEETYQEYEAEIDGVVIDCGLTDGYYYFYEYGYSY